MPKEEEQLDHAIELIQFVPDGTESIKGVNIKFKAQVEVAPFGNETDSKKKKTKYGAETEHCPHIDFVNAMNKLVDHGLAAVEIEPIPENRKEFIILGIKLSGDVDLNKARVSIIMAKRVFRSDELYVMKPTPELAMNSDGAYMGWKELLKDVKVVLVEATAFMNGKHFSDNVPLAFQLKLPLQEPKEEEVPLDANGKRISKHRRERTKKEPVIPVPDPNTINMGGPQAQA